MITDLHEVLEPDLEDVFEILAVSADDAARRRKGFEIYQRDIAEFSDESP